MKVGDCEIYFECTMHNCDARPERRRREGRRKKKYTSDHPPLLCDLIFSNLSYVFNLSTRSNLTSVLRCYTYILDVLVYCLMNAFSWVPLKIDFDFHISFSLQPHSPPSEKNNQIKLQLV